MNKKFSKKLFPQGNVEWGKRLVFSFDNKQFDEFGCVLRTEEIVCTGITLVLSMYKKDLVPNFQWSAWNDFVNNASVSQNGQCYSTILGGKKCGTVLCLTMQENMLPHPYADDLLLYIPLPFQFQGSSAWKIDPSASSGITVELLHYNLFGLENAYIEIDFEVRPVPLRRIALTLPPAHFVLRKVNEAFVNVSVTPHFMDKNAILRYFYFVPLIEEEDEIQVCPESLQVTFITSNKKNESKVESMSCDANAWKTVLKQNTNSNLNALWLSQRKAFVWTPAGEVEKYYFRENTIEATIKISYDDTTCLNESMHLIVEGVFVYDIPQRSVPDTDISSNQTSDSLLKRVEVLEQMVLHKK